jgi:hypothetical protein
MSAWVLNRCQACWNIILSCFNFMITYRPRFEQCRFDALLRCLYLAPKEGDAANVQQYFVYLKSKWLLLKTVYSTTSMDSTFLKDICISLL